MNKHEIIKMAKGLKFESKFLHNSPYKYSMQEPLRWLFWLTELQQRINKCSGFTVLVNQRNEEYCPSVGGNTINTPYPEYVDALEHGIVKAMELIIEDDPDNTL